MSQVLFFIGGFLACAAIVAGGLFCFGVWLGCIAEDDIEFQTRPVNKAVWPVANTHLNTQPRDESGRFTSKRDAMTQALRRDVAAKTGKAA